MSCGCRATAGLHSWAAIYICCVWHMLLVVPDSANRIRTTLTFIYIINHLDYARAASFFLTASPNLNFFPLLMQIVSLTATLPQLRVSIRSCPGLLHPATSLGLLSRPRAHCLWRATAEWRLEAAATASSNDSLQQNFVIKNAINWSFHI